MLTAQRSRHLLVLAVATGACLLGPSTHGQETEGGSAESPQTESAKAQTPEAEAQPQAAESEPQQQLEETVITGEALEEEPLGGVGNVSTATRTSTPLTEIPATVDVVPRQIIDDQAAQGLEDIYINVPNVTEAGNTQNAESEVRPIIRGFESQFLLRNGMRSTSVGSVDPVNIESVEVLKGPSSILYGQIEPGGALNITTKKPLDVPFYDIQQEFGSFDHYRTTLDATGPLNAEGTLMYRINGAFTDAASFRNDVELQRTSVNPSLLLRPSEDTEILFEFSFNKEEVPYDTGVPFSATGRPLVSPDTFFGDPRMDGRDLTDYFASYQIRQRLSDIWTFRNQFHFHRIENTNEGLRNRRVTGAAGSEMLSRRYQNQESRQTEFQFITDLVGEFSTGDVDHEALIGIDLYYDEFSNDRFRQNAPSIAISDNPDTAFTPATDHEPQRAWTGRDRRIGVYVQDQMTMLPEDRLHILIGGRFDYAESEMDNVGGPESTSYDDAFTGRIGALYDLTDWVSPYASISQSFQPQAAGRATASGNPIDPEEGLQYEAGLKFNFFEDRWITTLAAFQIEKENVAVFDSDHFNATGESAYLPGVERRSRGFEIYTVGRITDELSVIGGYGYVDSETTANPVNPAEVGTRFGGVPLHTGRVWLTYNFADGTTLEGLGFGGGVRFKSSQTAQFDDAIRLSGYGVVDLGIWYRRQLDSGQRIKLQLNVKNLFDKEYYARASDQAIVHPGEPTTVYGTIGIEF